MNKFSPLVLFVGLAISPVSSADELYMRNGSHLIGTLVSADRDEVVFKTPFAGTIKIKQANIDTIVTTDKVTIMMQDGTVYRDKRIIAREDNMVVQSEDQVPVMFDASDIKMLNPEPWRLGEGYQWSGNVSLALEAERGNSDTDEWDMETVSTWRSLEDRYRIKAWGEFDETNGEKVTEDWEVRSKYDRFSTEDPDNYWGGKLRFEYDKFADLDLRTIVGPHVGRQFFDSKYLSLSAELGPVWVDEQFDVAEANDWPGALWELEAESDIIGFGTTLYALHDGILNLDSPDDTLLNTTIGIRLPLIYGFETKLEVKYEYDGGAVEGVDDTDETYNVRIGYSW